MSTQDVIKKTVYEMFAGGSDMQPGRIIFLLAASAVIGLYIFAVYKNQSKSAFYSKDLNVTIAGLPIIVCGMLLAMQGSLVVSLGMVGALSIVRFRNAVKSPLDLLYFFWSISIGIMCGVGLVVLALFVSVIMTALVGKIQEPAGGTDGDDLRAFHPGGGRAGQRTGEAGEHRADPFSVT